MLLRSPQLHDSMSAARLSEVRHCPHYGQAAAYHTESVSTGEAALLSAADEVSQVAPSISRRNINPLAALCHSSSKSRFTGEAAGYKVVTDDIIDASQPLPTDPDAAKVAYHEFRATYNVTVARGDDGAATIDDVLTGFGSALYRLGDC